MLKNVILFPFFFKECASVVQSPTMYPWKCIQYLCTSFWVFMFLNILNTGMLSYIYRALLYNYGWFMIQHNQSLGSSGVWIISWILMTWRILNDCSLFMNRKWDGINFDTLVILCRSRLVVPESKNNKCHSVSLAIKVMKFSVYNMWLWPYTPCSPTNVF